MCWLSRNKAPIFNTKKILIVLKRTNVIGIETENQTASAIQDNPIRISQHAISHFRLMNPRPLVRQSAAHVDGVHINKRT